MADITTSATTVTVQLQGPQGATGPQGEQGIPGSITASGALIITGSVFASGSNGQVTASSHISTSGNMIGSTATFDNYGSIVATTITASANIGDMDEEAKKFPIVTKTETDVTLNSIMSNSFGFGGTNATLVFEKV